MNFFSSRRSRGLIKRVILSSYSVRHFVCVCVCVCCDRGKNRETILSSLQACFVIAHSSGDFIVKNIRTIVYILNKNNTSIVA